MIAAGVFILLNARQVPMLVLWLIVVGIAGAAPVALVPMVTAETLGLKRFGALFGWLGSVVTVGLFIGPLMVGWMTDVTGSYTTPFELCALICLVGSAASFYASCRSRLKFLRLPRPTLRPPPSDSTRRRSLPAPSRRSLEISDIRLRRRY
jgi:MFS family permease